MAIDAYERITLRILQQLEEGTVPWRKPWRGGEAGHLELGDLMISERGGTAIFRDGKGNKQRSVPLPCLAERLCKTISKRDHLFPLRMFLSASGDL